MDRLLQLRKRVDEELRMTKIVRGLFEGTPDRDAYVRYLINVYKYAQHSPKVMAVAAARSTDSHPELARYLLRHAEEEQGHDRWAIADLADMNVSKAEAQAARPVPSCAAMIGYMYYVAAHANPIGLFGWMYLLEAVGNDLGAAVATRLGDVLGKASGGTRFVAGHSVSDVDHTKDLTEQIDRYVRDDDDRAAVNEVADVVADLYVRMFRELGGERARWD